MGIEPTYSAWKAEVLPLNYTRAAKRRFVHQNRYNFKIWWRGEDDSGHPAIHPSRAGLRPFKFVPD